MMRSKLFVPGSRPELFDKALASDADAISIDLEDAVIARNKQQARELVGEFLDRLGTGTNKSIIVRVNGIATEHFEADLEAVARPGLDIVNLPKAESAADITTVVDRLERFERERKLPKRIGILANIESPRGLRCAAEIAAADARVMGLQIGFGDLFEPYGIDRGQATTLDQVRFAVRLAAAEAGIDAYDGAFVGLDNPDGFTEEARGALRLGFAGKSCVHPRQIALANDVFRPSDAQIAWALKVIVATREAEAAGRGAFMVDGQMVDGPFIARAEAIIALAQRLGLVPPTGV
ncbi:HpcH/HpaI aldolase/citrate lyase family protein [Leptospira interrogans]